MTVEQICNELGIHFVNRSYGKFSTSTISLDTLEKLAERVSLETIQKRGKLLAELPPIEHFRGILKG